MNLQHDKLRIISWLSRIEDEAVVQRLYFLMQSHLHAPLSSQQQQVLDGRLNADDANKLSFVSWEEAKANIRKKS